MHSKGLLVPQSWSRKESTDFSVVAMGAHILDIDHIGNTGCNTDPAVAVEDLFAVGRIGRTDPVVVVRTGLAGAVDIVVDWGTLVVAFDDFGVEACATVADEEDVAAAAVVAALIADRSDLPEWAVCHLEEACHPVVPLETRIDYPRVAEFVAAPVVEVAVAAAAVVVVGVAAVVAAALGVEVHVLQASLHRRRVCCKIDRVGYPMEAFVQELFLDVGQMQVSPK